METLDIDIKEFKGRNESIFISKMESFTKASLESGELRSWDLAEVIQAHLKRSLVETWSVFVKEEDQKVNELYEVVAKSFEQQIAEIINDVRARASELVGIEIGNLDLVKDLGSDHRFNYNTDPFFRIDTLFFRQVTLILPRSLFKGILTSRVISSSKEEFGKNAGRIRYEHFVSRLDKAIILLKRELDENLEYVINTVRKALTEGEILKSKEEASIRERMSQLDRMYSKLSEVEDQLEPSSRQ